ncbi:MAG: hypothetical protein NT040_12605 [Bacteroidetes bacterium]|nr:hypothetical protein [Bacteroidota bacterium]
MRKFHSAYLVRACHALEYSQMQRRSVDGEDRDAAIQEYQYLFA